MPPCERKADMEFVEYSGIEINTTKNDAFSMSQRMYAPMIDKVDNVIFIFQNQNISDSQVPVAFISVSLS